MYSYHNHTVFSDGKGTPAEMVSAAEKSGFAEFGISDHFGFFEDGTYPEESLKNFDEYFAQMSEIKAKSSVTVRIGTELENLPKSRKQIENILKNYPLDYIIGGTHYIDRWALDTAKEDWLLLGSDEIHRRILKYWDAVYDLCRYGDIDIIAHFDLYEKWGPLNAGDYTEYFAECVKVCKERELATEINTARRAGNGFYPSLSFLKLLGERDIPVIISADAHRPEDLRRNFEGVRDYLKAGGIKKTARFRNRTAEILYL